MEFPPRVLYPRRFHAFRAQYTADESAAAEAAPDLRAKLATLVDRNKKVKMAYQQLQSQIAFGLVEAGEVFESLAIPLMKLVGLKTSEMESEGRHSIFVFNSGRGQMDTSQQGSRSGDPNNQIRSFKEENYAAKAESAGKEIMHKHEGQLRQLLHMLKHIEKEVNSHHEDIGQMIDHRKSLVKEFIQKALYHLSSVHSQNHDTFPATVKLFRVLFNNIDEVLGSVDSGVNELVQALAKNMCNPMSKYIGNLAAEVKLGPCAQLMSVVNEMEKANAEMRRELEDARERIRVAEETKMEALTRLKKAEEQVQRTTRTSSRFLLPATQKQQAEHTSNGKRLGSEGSRENEEKLLWDLLSKRRKQQVPESPMGPQELIRKAETTQKQIALPRRTTRSQTRLSSPTARPDSLLALGLSPSLRKVTRR